MNDPIETKKYTIEFFRFSFPNEEEAKGFIAWLEGVSQSKLAPSREVSGYTREVWDIQKRGTHSASFSGQFRKFRTKDLPEVGSAGEKAAALELAENQGLVERNFFVYYPEQQIIGWCRNSHGSTVNQLCRFLSEVISGRVEASPLIEPDAIKRLMKNEVTLKKITFTVPRPTAPDMYSSNDFTQSTLQMMAQADADTMHISMGVSSRRGDSKGRLKQTLKLVLQECVSLGATTAKATVWEDNVEHPIDLIADRISSIQEIETNAKYPPSATMYGAIDDALQECRGPIDEYFGQMEDAIT